MLYFVYIASVLLTLGQCSSLDPVFKDETEPKTTLKSWERVLQLYDSGYHESALDTLSKYVRTASKSKVKSCLANLMAGFDERDAAYRHKIIKYVSSLYEDQDYVPMLNRLMYRTLVRTCNGRPLGLGRNGVKELLEFLTVYPWKELERGKLLRILVEYLPLLLRKENFCGFADDYMIVLNMILFHIGELSESERISILDSFAVHIEDEAESAQHFALYEFLVKRLGVTESLKEAIAGMSAISSVGKTLKGRLMSTIKCDSIEENVYLIKGDLMFKSLDSFLDRCFDSIDESSKVEETFWFYLVLQLSIYAEGTVDLSEYADSIEEVLTYGAPFEDENIMPIIRAFTEENCLKDEKKAKFAVAIFGAISDSQQIRVLSNLIESFLTTRNHAYMVIINKMTPRIKIDYMRMEELALYLFNSCISWTDTNELSEPVMDFITGLVNVFSEKTYSRILRRLTQGVKITTTNVALILSLMRERPVKSKLAIIELEKLVSMLAPRKHKHLSKMLDEIKRMLPGRNEGNDPGQN